MRISIKYKLLSILLLASALVFVTTYYVWYSNFSRGFLGYVSRIEERQIPALIKGLEDFYRNTGSWEAIRRSNDVFGGLINASIESATDKELIESLRQTRVTRSVTPNDWYYTSEYSPARPYLHLLDEKKEVIRGTSLAFSTELATLNPILVEGKTVGYLAVTSRQQLSEQGDVLFMQKQRDEFLRLALILGAISVLISFPAATILTRPVRLMVEGARALTSGDYNSRISVHSRDELGQLAEDFNTLASTLQQNQSARQQWIADISHELRTPLAILRGELEAMQDGVRQLNPDAVNSLHQEVVHLNTLVNDLHELSLSDIGALVYKKEPLDLADTLHTCLDKHARATNAELKVKLSIESTLADESLPLIGDPDRLMQLFDNLLQNSIRYTNAGGDLEVRAFDNGSQVIVEWQDSAPGVNDSDLEHLFDRLYRVEMSRNRAKGGSGLGLAICQNIISAHSGTIAASHSPLGGLRLTITFPRTIEVLPE